MNKVRITYFPARLFRKLALPSDVQRGLRAPIGNRRAGWQPAPPSRPGRRGRFSSSSTLFGAEGVDGVDAGGAAGGEIVGGQSHGCQEKRRGGED
jgi:hypothetical protein